MKELDRAKKIEVTFEFFLFGVIIGIVEDIVAVKVVTGEEITWEVVGIIVLIALPFAILGEIFADNIDFSKYIRPYLKDKQDKEE